MERLSGIISTYLHVQENVVKNIFLVFMTLPLKIIIYFLNKNIIIIAGLSLCERVGLVVQRRISVYLIYEYKDGPRKI